MGSELGVGWRILELESTNSNPGRSYCCGHHAILEG
jgi:hypothetical protein